MSFLLETFLWCDSCGPDFKKTGLHFSVKVPVSCDPTPRRPDSSCYTIGMAQGVWQFYALIWHKSHHYVSMHHLTKTWTHPHCLRTQNGLIALGISYFGCWEICKSRCCVIFEDIPVNTASILRNMTQQLKTLNGAGRCAGAHCHA
ncbi:hypothetical protein ABFS83_12G051600 [Erythranthe nasuta]